MSRPNTKPSAAAGFTLIELMVTVLIAAILLAIAVPAYQTYIRKSRRTEAKTAVLDLAGREETLFSTTNNYSANSNNVGYGAGPFPVTFGNLYYSITVVVAAGVANAPPTFTVTAVPAAGSSQLLDTACQSFSVDQLGNQTALDAGGAVNTTTCWGN
jgi:type IV pilus assembly protein PilE